MTTAHQAAVLAYRVEESQLKVLLVTSRDTKRWIIPKGNIGRGLTALEAARKEAFEEAGLLGEFHSDVPLGFYMYFKRKDDGSSVPTSVEVYLFAASQELKKFPEKGERKLRWVSVDRALGKIEEPGVVPILKRLKELEPSLIAAPAVALSA